MRNLTVTESVHVARPPEEVWDFTQDYARRPSWDASVIEAEDLGGDPRRVRVTLRGMGPTVFEYKLNRRPERTSLRMTGMTSRWVVDGGGSWEYAPEAGGTRWTQTNTLVVPRGVLALLVAPLIARNLRTGTKRSMQKAKQILEGGQSG